MSKSRNQFATSMLALAVAGAGWAQPIYAQNTTTTVAAADAVQEIEQEQDAEEKGEAKDDIVVIGSYLNRGEPQNAASPVSVLGRDELLNAGEIDLTAAVFDMPVNQGSESQPNIFFQNFSAGTAQYNLRGLGLGSTLVLIDGKRVVTSASSAQDGSTFVDINSVPKIAVSRIEVLKDGAAALYGSDAVAGVVNYGMRNTFTGVELTGSYQSTYKGDQHEFELAGIVGKEIGQFNVVAAVNYMRRYPLAALDRKYTHGTGYSRSGQPGNYILLPTNGVTPPVPANPPLTPDPDCEAGNGVIDPGPTNHCLYDFIPPNQLVIPEDRWQAYASVRGDIGDVKTNLNLIYANGRVLGQTLPPSLPATGGIVPATHPNNPFGFDAVFIGRPFASNSSPGIINRKNETLRIAGDLEGDIGGGWTWKTGLQYSTNYYRYNYPDTRLDRLNAALRGQGGPNNNEYFNPFGASTGNSDAVLNDIRGNAMRIGRTKLFTADALAKGEIDLGLSGGNVGIAFGAQYRKESLKADFDPFTNNFELAYLGGAKDFSGSRGIFGLFSEISLPITDRLELKAAGRFERYADAGSTVDPKFAVRFEPVDGLVFRGSYSTTFRAPSLLQTNGFQGAVAEIQPGQFRTVLFTPNKNLKNETANVFNVGTVYETQSGLFGSSDKLFLSADYWSFSYSNVITGVNPVQMVNDFTAALAAGTATHNNLNTSTAFRDYVLAGGTGVFSRNNSIAGVISPFVNAASMKTSGIDVELNYRFPVGGADVTLKTAATRTLKYDLKPYEGAATIDGLGQRNFFNFGRSNTNLRINSGLNITAGRHSFGVNARYNNGYNDEVNKAKIRSQTEVDAYYSLDIPETGSSIAAGVTNLFDRDPPYVKTFFGFDSQQADPRGGMFYIRLMQKFGGK